VKRALCWIGACPYKRPPQADVNPEKIRGIARPDASRPSVRASFDIAVGHASWQQARNGGRKKAYSASLAESGATWWCLYVVPDSEKTVRRIIEQGPFFLE
jgi:hypothetical protein